MPSSFERIRQCDFLLLSLRRSSSLPKSLIRRLIGVKSPKKMIPITTGLTIFPRSNPKAIHNLLRRLSDSAWTSVTVRKRMDVIAKPYRKTVDSI